LPWMEHSIKWPYRFLFIYVFAHMNTAIIWAKCELQWLRSQDHVYQLFLSFSPFVVAGPFYGKAIDLSLTRTIINKIWITWYRFMDYPILNT
jgi:hypothetical protein